MSKHLDELERVYKGMADAQKAASPTCRLALYAPMTVLSAVKEHRQYP